MSALETNRTPSRLVTSSMLVVLCLVWGSTWLAIREGLDETPPYTSAAIRFVLAGIAMTPVARAFGKREGGRAPPFWLWSVVGLCNFALSYGIVYRTEVVLPSGLVSLLWGVFPMITALAGHFFLPNERLRGPQWAGFVVGFVGLGILFFTDLRQLGPDGVPAALVLFMSPVLSTVGNTLLKRYGQHTSSLVLNRNAMLLGGVLLGGVAWLTERDAPRHFTAGAWASLAYLTLCGTTLAFGLYFWLLRYVSAYQLSLISYVTPGIALALGAWVRREPLTRNTLLGAAFIAGGLVLVMRGKRAPS